MFIEQEEGNYNKFRCIKLAYQAGSSGGTYPVVLNVANDLSVELFLKNKINFLDIERNIEECLSNHSSKSNPDINDIRISKSLNVRASTKTS